MDYELLIMDIRAGDPINDNWQLTFDNDGGYWKYIGDLGIECNECYECAGCIEIRKEAKRLEGRYGSPEGYCDVVNIARAAGINAEWC